MPSFDWQTAADVFASSEHEAEVEQGQSVEVAGKNFTNKFQSKRPVCSHCGIATSTIYRMVDHHVGKSGSGKKCTSVPGAVMRAYARLGNDCAEEWVAQQDKVIGDPSEPPKKRQLSFRDCVFSEEDNRIANEKLFRAMVRNGVPLNIFDDFSFRGAIQDLATGFALNTRCMMERNVYPKELVRMENKVQSRLQSSSGGSVESDGAFQSCVTYVFSGPEQTCVVDAVDYDDKEKNADFVCSELVPRIDKVDKHTPCVGACLDNCATHVGSQAERGTGFEKNGALGKLQSKYPKKAMVGCARQAIISALWVM